MGVSETVKTSDGNKEDTQLCDTTTDHSYGLKTRAVPGPPNLH